MKKVLGYLQRHAGQVAIACLLFLMQFLFLLTSHVELQDIIYLIGLELFVVAGVLLTDYIRYRAKIQKLGYLLSHDVADYMDLEEELDCIDASYIEMIRRQEKNRRKLESDYSEARNAMREYYNMWVHQIKTPIAAMNVVLQSNEHGVEENYAAYLETEQLADPEAFLEGQREMVRELQSQLFSVEEYVNMALQYQRMRSESKDYVLKAVELNGVVRENIRRFARLFIGKKLAIDYEKTSAVVYSDEKWLNFVIGQLLSNAIKYSKKGTITIATKQENNFVYLLIKDEGIGISQEDLPRVFERGYTGYNGRADKSSTGIGLFLCKEVLEKLGHTIKIESKLGEGTTVWVGMESQRMITE